MSKGVALSIFKDDRYDDIRVLKNKLNTIPNELSSYEIEELVKHGNKKLNSIRNFDVFEEYYTGNKKKLIEAIDTLSPSAYVCFSILVLKWTSTENTLQYKNHVNIVRDKDLCKLLEISSTTWTSIKKELISFDAIRKINFDGKSLYKINPTIIGHSMKITKCTYYAFRNQLYREFDVIKRLYWDKILIEEYGIDIFG